MAKRKRLTPAAPESFGAAAAPETKGMFLDAPVGLVPRGRAAPIADIAADTAREAALDELSRHWVEARREGKLVIALPLEKIRLDHIERDRMGQDPEEAEALRESLRRRGQQTPIEVVELPGGDYGLISGWRRCRALADLHAETGEERFATVQALLRQPEETPDAYVAMVEENEIRSNLSHYERARIVVRATEAGVFDDTRAALSALFASAPRARRSKIGSFVPLVQALDDVLRFPTAMSERVGLELSQALRERPAFAKRLSGRLAARPPEDAEAERRAILSALAAEAAAAREPRSEPAREVLGDWSGLRLYRDRPGRLSLEGEALTPELEADLRDWLAARRSGTA
ncbi:ParB/RepB/Spo0J family partition protein [Limimaricola pyoseonensis]|uniref:ParB/RepB/Spo0J family partition protein n=1 Tax=Limimaricola pyoseonensis TaxID=521013 RepID=A0A1G7KJM9_9RHOB|nr:ParB N-terminal domain-containing protein [Limimaricola pyoseonensis]SDF37009.1 ParB/RepB/Spo0J family partition protein [Limimaricola pyoseonensis]